MIKAITIVLIVVSCIGSSFGLSNYEKKLKEEVEKCEQIRNLPKDFIEPNKEDTYKEKSWISASELCSHCSIAPGKIHPFQDVQLGQIENDWLISALAGYFSRNGTNEIYSNVHETAVGVILHDHQTPKCIIMDTQIPFRLDDKGKPTYKYSHSQSHHSVALIEKAVAQLFKGYDGLMFGTVEEGHGLVTGESCYVYAVAFNSNKKTLVDSNFCTSAHEQDFQRKIKNAFLRLNGSILYTHVHAKSKSEEEKLKSLGLINDHVYNIIDLIEFKGKANERKQEYIFLLKITEVSHRAQWSGKWGFDDNAWTEYAEMKDKLLGAHRMTGTFVINLNDFRKYFGDVYGCAQFPVGKYDFLDGSFPTDFTDSANVYEFKSAKKSRVQFDLVQHGARNGMKTDRYEVGLVIYKKETDGAVEYTKLSCFTSLYSCTVDAKLSAGTYLAVPFSPVPLSKAFIIGSHNSEYTFKVTAFGNDDVFQINKVTYSPETYWPLVLEYLVNTSDIQTSLCSEIPCKTYAQIYIKKVQHLKMWILHNPNDFNLEYEHVLYTPNDTTGVGVEFLRGSATTNDIVPSKTLVMLNFVWIKPSGDEFEFFVKSPLNMASKSSKSLVNQDKWYCPVSQIGKSTPDYLDEWKFADKKALNVCSRDSNKKEYRPPRL